MWLNLCAPLEEAPCADGTCTACMQWDPTQAGGKACMGVYTQLTYSEDAYGIQAVLSGGQSNRQTIYQLICDKNTSVFLHPISTHDMIDSSSIHSNNPLMITTSIGIRNMPVPLAV